MEPEAEVIVAIKVVEWRRTPGQPDTFKLEIVTNLRSQPRTHWTRYSVVRDWVKRLEKEAAFELASFPGTSRLGHTPAEQRSADLNAYFGRIYKTNWARRPESLNHWLDVSLANAEHSPPVSYDYEGLSRRVAAWVFGPKGENFPEFEQLIHQIISQTHQWREVRHPPNQEEYLPGDVPYVTDHIKESSEYKEQRAVIQRELGLVLTQLRKSMPFWNSRYKGHMSFDTSLVGQLGYFAAMLYDPNNVATEGDTITETKAAQ